MKRVVVIGAGVGGLAAAAVLARRGIEVTVLEAHVYPGGCAGTFFHRGYRFDAGATLAGGFYPGGPMDILAQAAGIAAWPVRSADPAMSVHLPDGRIVQRFGDERRWDEYRNTFGPGVENFWRWQERTANTLWRLALRNPAWPPQTPGDLIRLIQNGLAWLGEDLGSHLSPHLLADAFRPVGAHLADATEAFKLFVDAQLLISAQTTSPYANALYGAAALDLPRRGVVHVQGGMGAIAQRLAEAVRANGGQVLYRRAAQRIVMERGRAVAVETQRGESFPADTVIANLTPWNLRGLFGEDAPVRLRRLPDHPLAGWGAFMLYLGADGSVFQKDAPLHQQVIHGPSLGEGGTIFLSVSPEWDASRAPAGRRAVTISTHTELSQWRQLFETDREGYEKLKQVYTHRLLEAAETAIPGLLEAASLTLPGTPLSFARFTRRKDGWVGGFPQIGLPQGWGPRITKGVWMVGDSIFPGQSVAATALGGLRVANDVLGVSESEWAKKDFQSSIQAWTDEQGEHTAGRQFNPEG